MQTAVPKLICEAVTVKPSLPFLDYCKFEGYARCRHRIAILTFSLTRTAVESEQQTTTTTRPGPKVTHKHARGHCVACVRPLNAPGGEQTWTPTRGGWAQFWEHARTALSSTPSAAPNAPNKLSRGDSQMLPPTGRPL